MGELEEFAEALLDQLSVEINEEKEISELADKISEDASFTVKFDELENICQGVFPQMATKGKRIHWDFHPASIEARVPGIKGIQKDEGKKGIFF